MIDDFYKRIEAEYDVENHSWDLFSDLGNLSENDKVWMRYEFFALNNFEADSFKTEIEAAKKPLIDYFIEREQKTKNSHLLARYNHFLLYITRNNSYASKAIEYYQQVLAYYLSIHKQGSNTLHFADTLECIILLSTKYKTKTTELKAQINTYLYDETISTKAKTFWTSKLYLQKELSGNFV